VWAYSGTVPGPVLRLPQGEPFRAVVENRLSEPTTVHWHGVRLRNAMDGVPDLTQAAIPPGASVTYDFTPPDAGTYWYHPHAGHRRPRAECAGHEADLDRGARAYLRPHT
jgi:FtsP/CotA-like multicopper oxidase with cupredoxin domain